MNFATGCSGINSCAVAWNPLGWEEMFCAEIEPFPAAVLAHRFPRIPNLGDITAPDFVTRARKILAGRKLDVLCMGTPCQSFSVAGKRLSLQDRRGNLALTLVEINDELGSTWTIWENVPGCLNTADNAFGCFLGGLAGAHAPFPAPDPREPGKWTRAGVFQGPKRGGAWRVLDAQYVGGCELHDSSAVPQRRERVFVIARLGADGCARAAEALFESRGEGWDFAASGEEGQQITPYAGGGAKGVAHALKASPQAKHRLDQETMVVETIGGKVAHTLKGEGADASEDGTGRGVPIIALNGRQNPISASVAPPVDTDGSSQIVAFGSKDSGQDAGPVSPTIRAGGHDQSHENGGVPPAIAIRTEASGANGRIDGSVTKSLDTGSPAAVAFTIHGTNKTAKAASETSVASALRATPPGRVENSSTTVIVQPQEPMVFEPRIARNGRGAPEKVCPPLKAENGTDGRDDGAPVLFAMMPQNSSKDFKAKPSDVAHPLMGAGPASGDQGGDVVIFTQNSRSEVRLLGGDGSVTGAVASEPGAQQQNYLAAPGYVVRRFTCRECERLQGFPDDFTLIPWKGKREDYTDQFAYLLASGYPEAEARVLAHCPDIGNSKATTVVQWIGRRIERVEAAIR